MCLSRSVTVCGILLLSQSKLICSSILAQSELTVFTESCFSDTIGGMGKAGRVLKQVLQTYGISQGKLAASMGVWSSNVYRWANEVRDPSAETIVQIVESLEKINPDAAAEFRRLYIGESEPGT